MQVKTTARYHFTRMTITIIIIIKAENIYGEEMEKLEPSYIAGGNAKWNHCCGKQFGG